MWRGFQQKGCRSLPAHLQPLCSSSAQGPLGAPSLALPTDVGGACLPESILRFHPGGRSAFLRLVSGPCSRSPGAVCTGAPWLSESQAAVHFSPSRTGRARAGSQLSLLEAAGGQAVALSQPPWSWPGLPWSSAHRLPALAAPPIPRAACLLFSLSPSLPSLGFEEEPMLEFPAFPHLVVH